MRSLVKSITIITFFLLSTVLGARLYAASGAGYSEYLVPGSEQQIYNTLHDIRPSNVNDPTKMHAVISIVAGADGTVVYYDHHEDGYDMDDSDPEGTADFSVTLNKGELLILESKDINTAHTGINDCTAVNGPVGESESACYDGQDRFITTGGPVTVSRASWSDQVGTVFQVAWEVYPIKALGREYVAPFGENLSDTFPDFKRSYILAMATEDNTDVTAGGASVMLDKGEVISIPHNNTGDTVSADKPLYAISIVGDQDEKYESRGFTMVPKRAWSNSYYAPVGTTSVEDGEAKREVPANIYLYNPQTEAITINYADKEGNQTIAINAGETEMITIAEASAAHLTSSEVFLGVSSVDATNNDWDWGYSLISDINLKDNYLIGWAPGTLDREVEGKGSPLHVTPTEDGTRVFVDYAPHDGVADQNFTLDRFDSQVIHDMEGSPYDMTGGRIWSSAPIAVVWGEQALLDTAGANYMDMGYACLPQPDEWLNIVFSTKKSVDSEFISGTSGTRSRYTLVFKSHNESLNGVSAKDILPDGWAYVDNSAHIVQADSSELSGNSADPTVTGQKLVWDTSQLGAMEPDQNITVIYEAITTQNFPVGTVATNCVESNTSNYGGTLFVADDCQVSTFVPSISIDDVTSNELHSGSSNFNFTISIDSAWTSDITVVYSTLDGNATVADSDYIAKSGSTTISAGATSVQVSVEVKGDLTAEENETFFVTLADSTNAVIIDSQGIGTIINDDVTGISIDDVTSDERHSGASNFEFTISLSNPSSSDITVDYNTTDNNATAGEDYNRTSGRATISAGSTSTTISVPVLGDTTVETDETFTVVLSNPSAATISDNSGTGTIINDDRSGISIDDVAHSELHSGSSNFEFTISINNVSASDITVEYTTSDGTANAESDYTAMGGTATITAGRRSTTLSVVVAGDTTDETDETFTVVLSNPNGATIADGSGSGTIRNDDNSPIAEDDTHATLKDRPVSIPVLTNDHDSDGDAICLTAIGTSTGGAPFVTTNGGTVTWDEGGTVIYAPASAYIGTDIFNYTISDCGDNSDTAKVTITITDSDDPNSNSVVAVGDSASVEVNGSVDIAVLANDYDLQGDEFGINSVDATSSHGGTVQSMNNGTPGDSSDDYLVYQPADSFIGDDTFAYEIRDTRGAVDSATVVVTVRGESGDSVPNAVDDSATTDRNTSVTIDVLANDTHPNAGEERNITAFTQPANGAVVRNNGGIPANPSDDKLTYTPNPNFSGYDSFTYRITDATGDTSMASVTVTVMPLPTISINDVTSDERHSGASNFEFTISISNPSSGDTTVDYNTTDSNATAGEDYNRTSGRATINAGSISTTISISVLGDTTVETDETFTVVLNNPSGATISDASGTGTILNDDNAPVAEDDSHATLVDRPVSIPVLNNDHDRDGDALCLIAVGTSTGGTPFTTTSDGTVTWDENGTVIYMPASGYIGSDTFDYTISDCGENNDTATVTITITDPDDLNSNSVVAVGDSASTEVNSSVEIDVMANDYDLQGDEFGITYVQSSTVNGGTVQLRTNGTAGDTSDDYLVYRPADNFIGNDTFSYRIGDERGAADSAIVVVTVRGDSGNPGNDPVPNAVDDSVTADQNVSITIDVLANDTHPNAGEERNITAFTQPANGAVVCDDGGTPANPSDDKLTYTPHSGFSGHDSFTYRITDATGDTATASVTVMVVSSPIIAIGDATIEEGGDLLFGVTLSHATATDVVVDITTSSGTATAGSDYTDTTATVTIPAGSVATVVLVSSIDDTRDESEEHFIINGRVTSGNTANQNPSARGTITDNDTPPPASSHASLGDLVWYDYDADGMQGIYEDGVPNVKIYLLDSAGNAVQNSSGDDIYKTTDRDGEYLFEGLASNTSYRVQFDLRTLPDGFTPTIKGDGSMETSDSDADPITGKSKSVLLSVGENNGNVDMGIIISGRQAHIGDYFWIDQNHDGKQNPGEEAVEGGIVELLDNSGNPVTDNNGDQRVVVGPDGRYGFDVPPGEYQVRFTIPSSVGYEWYEFTSENSGVNIATDSDVNKKGLIKSVTVTAGQNFLLFDAGVCCQTDGFDADEAPALNVLGLLGMILIIGWGALALLRREEV